MTNAGAALSHVFAFTDRREELARFYEAVLGLRRDRMQDDSVWFDPSGGATFAVHDRSDEPRESGFVPWFHVSDVASAFDRASARGAAVGALREGYFFARDPDGRVFGVRQWR